MARRGTAGLTTLAVAALSFLGSSCVTTVLEGPEAVDATGAQPIDLTPIILPLGPATGTATPHQRYYVDVLGQMQEALQERDLERLRGLLLAHGRSDAPDWAVEQMRQFGDAALGLEFELHVARHSRIELAGAEAGTTVSLGARLDFELVVQPPSGRVVRPGAGSGTGLRFLVTLRMTDHDGRGGKAQRTSSLVLEPPDERRGSVWRVPFSADVPAGNSVLREIETGVELLPGVVEIDGREASVRRLLIVSHPLVLYPRGFEPIREQPLVTLRNAIALGDPEHFPHQYLAAQLMPAADREAALELLMPVIRLGSDEQARVAMSCAQVVTGSELPVVDRGAWLEWWRRRDG